MGAQKDPAQPNFDPEADPDESPVNEVALAPYFLSKYEMTQAQWLRFTGKNPSNYVDDGPRALLHPVEQVSWEDCEQLLRHMGLTLPTEAQWEYAARAGTRTPWWTGADASSVAVAANLSDAFAKSHKGPDSWTYEVWSDGHLIHAPVGSLQANAFGLHDVHGNVWEWCQDAYEIGYVSPTRTGDGERAVTDTSSRVLRGGSFSYPASVARSSLRRGAPPAAPDSTLGLRPARRITP